ncbi:MAG: phage tail tape measure protein [Rhodospirillales bacterium]|nr:phage tail tape measure protein [Rhodospirillales bacterium]
MGDRNLAIRLAVIDGGKVKAELRDVGDSGARALQRIEDASRPASRALQALDGVAGEVRGGLEAMSGRLGAVGSGLARLGPLGLAAGAALAGVGIAVSKGIEEAAKADQSYRRLDAVLKATGYASGLTAKEISSFADGIERSTLATAEGMQDAASILATFRSVSGETFTRALSLAQDMSAVFGQDLAGAATQLGKALEDPIDGLTALRRVGVSFSDTQKELIRSLVETGQTAEAQRVILDALEQQVGGAGAAEAGGLTGATNRLQDAWGNLLEAIGRTPAVTSLAQGALDLLSGAIEGISSAIDDDPVGQRIAAATAQLTQARDELARLEAGGPATPLLGQRFAIDEQHQRVAALEQELAMLTRIGEAETQAAAEERGRAEAGRLVAEAERRADALATQRSQLDKALEQLTTDPAERIAQVNRELAETKKRLEALRAPDGGNASNVDAAIHEAEEIARRKIAAINQPLEEAARRAREAADRQTAAEQVAAERAYQANEKVIDDLAKQLALFGDERRQFVDQALSRLSESATDEQWVQVERLANALYEEKLAREQLAESLRTEQQLRQQGARLTEQMRTPAEKLAATLQQLDALMQAGAIDAGTHGRAIAEAYREAEQAADRMLATSRDWQDGVMRALRDYADQAMDAASAAEQVTTQAFQGMEDALVGFVTTGKLDFASLVDSMIADLARLSIRMAVLGPLAQALSGGLGGLASGLFGSSASIPGSGEPGAGPGPGTGGLYAEGGVFAHGTVIPFAQGGVVDRPTLFPMARGYGLMGEAGPEAVLPLKRLSSGRLGVEAAGGPQVTVNIINNAGAKVTTEEQRDPSGNLSLNVIIDAVEVAMAQRATRPGSTLNRALAAAANPIRAR